MYAQPQLPVNPLQAQFPMLNINPNMPPYVPNNLRPDPRVAQYMPYISGVLAIQVQQNAAQNALRMFLFNMAANNNFANAYFDEMAAFAIQFTGYIVANQQGMGIEQAITQATALTQEYFAANNCRAYPGLMNYIDDPHVRNTVSNLIGEFDQIKNAIGQWVNASKQQQNFGFQQQVGFQGHAGGGGTSFMAGIGGGGTNFAGSLPPSTQTQWDAPATAVQQAVPAAAPVPDEVQTLPAHTHNWNPNLDAEPYFYAYDPRTWNASLRVSNGYTFPQYEPKSEQEKMDFDKHATPLALGKLPAFIDMTNAAKTMERIADGIRNINAETQEDVASDVTIVKTLVSDDWLFNTSDSGAWMCAALKRLQVEPGPEGMPDVYRVYARVADPVISEKDESEIVRKLAKSKTFLVLRDKIAGLGDEMSAGLYNAINQRLTELINRKLRLELGLRKVSITNFFEDIGDIPAYLEKKFSTVVKDAFLRNEEEDIARTLIVPSDATAASEASVIMAGMKFPKDNPPHLTFVLSNYSLTFLECLSWELNVEFANDIPVRLDAMVTPVFYDLVKGAFDDAARFDNEEVKDLAIGRVLMRTKDGRVFECTRGSLAEEAYLITLIK